MENSKRKRRKRLTFTYDQYDILEREFASHGVPNPAKCLRIAHKLGLTSKTDLHRVKIWFINREQRERKSYENGSQRRKKVSKRGSSTSGRSRQSRLRSRATIKATSNNVKENGDAMTGEVAVPKISSITQPQREATDKCLLVEVVSPDGRCRTFSGTVTIPFLMVKKQYAELEQVSESQVLFVYKGRVVHDDETPATLGRRLSGEIVIPIVAYFLEQSARNANLPVMATLSQPQTEPISSIEPNAIVKDVIQPISQDSGSTTSAVQDSTNPSKTTLAETTEQKKSESSLTGRPLTNKARKSFTFNPKKAMKDVLMNSS